MKAGQLIGFIAEGLPPEAQAALATLQADVPPDGAEPGRVRRAGRAGRRPRAPLPPVEPGAGGGRVDRPGAPGRAARRPDRGRQGAVSRRRPRHPRRPRQRRAAVPVLLVVHAAGPRREGPGRRAAGPAWATSSTTASRPRTRQELADRYRGHPFIRVPDVVPELSTGAGAHHRVGRRPDVGRVRGVGAARPPSSGPARSCSASPRARSTATACSTATPIPATTASRPTARSRSSTSVS